MIKVLVVAFAVVLGGMSAAGAQGVLRIAAVVNDEIISVQDLSERIQLVMSTSNLPDTPEVVKRVAPQILRVLIDERLKRQEAERAGITVEQADIDEALAEIERNNKVPPGQLDAFLASRNLPKGGLVEKIRNDLAWSRYVARRLRPQVRVGEDEISDMVARIQATKGMIELRVSEIFLPIEDSKRASEVRALADRLVEQARRGDFASIAQNFSQSPSAAAGGDLGWVTKGQIEDPVFEALKNLQPGALAGPVENANGISIYQLRGRRAAGGLDAATKVSLDLTQMVVPVSGRPEDAINAVQTMAAKASDCRSFREAAKESGSRLSGDIGTVSLTDLPQQIRDVVQGLRVNEKSKPTMTQDGATIYMVCGREGGEAEVDPRQRVRTLLVRERVDLLVRRELRDLRRDAFIEIRI